MQDYVLITAARNEENYIEKTIQSVASQTRLPLAWVIVDDDSQDHTWKIIQHYAQRHSFIKPYRLQRTGEWSFKSKAGAINYGYTCLDGLQYGYIGIVDADVTFESDYYQKMIERFHANDTLGIVGGMIWEMRGGKFVQLHYNQNSVSGAIQLFRRDCYEAIGGYIPSKRGGIDAIAEIMARMHGWKIKSFPDQKVYHHRVIGTTRTNLFKTSFIYGRRDYVMGNHPLFMFLKSIHRFAGKPYIIGGILMMLGYSYSSWIKEEKPVEQSVVDFLRREQVCRIRDAIKRRIPFYDPAK